MTELFKDWEERSQSPEESEALKELLAEITPLRERLENPKATEQEIFSDLNRLEEIVTARRAEMEARSLEPHAADMAAAIESVEGMSAMAAALRRGDFETAHDQAAKLEKALGDEKAAQALPPGAAESADRFSAVGEKLESAGQSQAAQGMKQLAQGAREGSRKQMSHGMQQLKSALNSQCNGSGECNRLSAQLAQIAAMRAGMCEGKSACEFPGLAALLQPKSGKGGSNAGSSHDPNLHGDATNLAASLQQEQLTGQMSGGESETTTLKAESGSGQATRSEVAQASFQTYEQLSRQAIEDETLPVAHRQSIKEYFERIRPAPKR